jgi:transposase
VAASLAELPDDPAILKQIIAQRESQIEQIKREAAQRIEAVEQQHQKEISAILRRFYGPHSERFDPAQLLLFGLKVAREIPVDEKTVESEAGEKLKTRRIAHHKHGRRELPAHLPRVEIPHDLSDEQKKCPCCGETRLCIGNEVSEQLEFVSASFKVLRHLRSKYACKPCGDGVCLKCDGQAHIEIAIKPAQPIEKGLPGPGLLAHLIVSKLGDHLPLYRLEKIFDRQGIDIARSTMCAWMLACGQLVKPLVELMAKRVKQSQVIHTDDTRVPVQDETIKGKCKSGRIWTYIGDEDHPDIIYEYTPDRTRAGPQKFLDDFKGYLQADAYGGYDGVYTKGLVHEVACWAHARRKFFDAQETDGRRSAQMLASCNCFTGSKSGSSSVWPNGSRTIRR